MVQDEDEPGADQRFKGILKRALNTPPPRKQHKAHKPKTSEEPVVADNRAAPRVVEVETPEPRLDGAETPEVKGVGAAKPVAAVAQQ